MHLRALLLSSLLALAWPGAPGLLAQSQGDARAGAGRATVRGAVVETGTARPLAGIVVVLRPEAGGAFPGSAPGAFMAESRAVRTDSLGHYAFDALPAGLYRVHASGPGYRDYAVSVELRAGRDVALSIGLAPDPIELAPMHGAARAPAPYRRAWNAGDGAALTPREIWQLRPRRSLVTDAYELTEADMVEAVTLGEPDLFRALQRLPGITTRSDYTAELWTRGASWSQTRVFYDGVPLLNPLHGLGSFSALSPGAVGALWVHSGVRPAAVGEGAAGAIDIRSRSGQGDGHLNAAADLSLVSTSLGLDQRVRDDLAWSITGRRTYLDWIAGAVRRAGSNDGFRFPYAFWDVAGRVDAGLGGASALEASGVWQRDRFAGEGADAPAAWGNRAGRVTLLTRRPGLEARHTLGASRYDAVVEDSAAVGADDVGVDFPAESRSRVNHVSITGEWRPDEAGALMPSWSAGYTLVYQSALSEGAPALAVPRAGVVFADAVAPADSFSARGTLWTGALWAERLWRPTERLGLQAGARLEAGERVHGAAPARLAPRASLRYALRPELIVSAGVGRSYQYTQVLAPSGVRTRSLSSSQVWLLSGDHVPAITADIATLGAEAWLGGGWTASASVYARRAAHVAIPDPAPGPVYGRRAFVVGTNEATGVELSARRIAGRWTASASYALGTSGMRVEGLRFDAPADRRHVLDATAMLRTSPALRVGAALTAASGVPYTRIERRPVPCSPDATACTDEDVAWFGPPNAERSPAFASLDLLADWTGSVAGMEAGAFVQLRNALGRSNETLYIGGGPGCERGRCGPRIVLENRTEAGLPRLPVVGLRVRF